MVDIFLGEPHANVKQWIIEHYSQPAGHAETWVKYAGDTTWTPINIQGSIEGSWDDDIGDYIPTNQILNIGNVVELEIGTNVTSIGRNVFQGCSRLTSVTIPDSVTEIGPEAFFDCSGLTSVTFLGKTLAQVQEMDHYPWVIEDESIINVA